MTHDETHSTIEEIDCMQELELLYAYLDGELDDPEMLAKFEHHLKHCRNCFTRTEFESVLTERLKISVHSKVPESLQNRLRKLVDDF